MSSIAHNFYVQSPLLFLPLLALVLFVAVFVAIFVRVLLVPKASHDARARLALEEKTETEQ